MIHLESISALNKALQQPSPKHPLVSIVDFTKMDVSFEKGTRISTNFYSVIFKNYCSNKIKYGRQYYDFEEGNLMCIAPKQVLIFDDETEVVEHPIGWGLFFHPDLIRGSALAMKMKEYSFFSYQITESLHLSEKERQTLQDCVLNIEQELNENIDHHSQNLIVSNLELLLNYCARYYDRQLITRKVVNHDIVSKVEDILDTYFQSEDLSEKGLPSVKYIASLIHLSPNYLSDVLKKETGMNTQDHIHYRLIEMAKILLLQSQQTISEIAYSLGFEYPQYFSKLFKLKTGNTPAQFREIN